MKIEFFKSLESKVSSEDDDFLYKCFKRSEMESFRKYYGIVNINKHFVNKELVGMVFDTPNRDIIETPKYTKNGLFLSHLCIKPDKRGNGYGSLLVKKILKKAKSNGYDHIILLVRGSNKKAINLYNKLGFTRYKEGKMTSGETAYYFVKFI